MRDYNGPAIAGMDSEPMIVGAADPGREALRAATQEARYALRMELNGEWATGDWDIWMSHARILQILDEGSLGVADMIPGSF